MAMTIQLSRWFPTVEHLVVVLLLVSQVGSVNRDNFKTCDQSAFCKRHRAMARGQSPYVVLMDSMKIQASSVEFHILNTNNNVRLLLQLYGLEKNTARLKINELDPMKARYEIPVGDVLIGEPKQKSIKVLEKTDQSITVGLDQNKVLISSKPFRVDFFTDDEPVVSINAQGLLKFEHYRTKQEAPAEPAKEENQEAEEKKEEEKAEDEEQKEEEKKEEQKPEEEPGLWEETYKSFHDSKPFGPSSVGIDVSFPGFEHVYGIPEHADSLALKTTKDTDPYRLFNLDVFEYELYNPMALYGSVPVMLAHNEKKTVGIFWNNAAETWIDIRSNIADKNFFSKVGDWIKGNTEAPQTDTHWFSEAGIIDIFIMLGPQPKDVFRQYAELTGTTQLPPLFAISYHQCRWNYNDQDDVRNVDATFDKFDIPFDVIWLDIEHTDGKRYFTWDKDRFSHPEDMINNVAVKGRKMVTIVDPHLKRDDGYSVYSDAKNKDLMVKNKDGGEYEGWCWPGSSSWPDFTNPEVRKWWASKFDLSQYSGSTASLHVWNDMNEPSVFNGPEITFHKDVKHHGGWENRDLHNLYGMYVQQATMEGLLQRSGNQERPFVLTRAFFAGSQRFGAVWTGDNMGDWSHLKASNPMILSLNIVGITFSGADVGGFFHNPDNELLTRWYQAGAFQPFFRAHAHLDTKRREPYLLPEGNMRVIRNAIRARYTFLPYWYTLFYHGEKEGLPVMLPLWVEFCSDRSTFNMDDQYLIGSSLLVKPITDAGSTTTNVYFPGKNEVWYDIQTAHMYEGGHTAYIDAPLEKIPVFQRGGSIIPRKMRVRRSSSLMRSDPFTLVICLDKHGEAKGDLYIDDYHSLKYKQKQYLLRNFIFKNSFLQSRGHVAHFVYSDEDSQLSPKNFDLLTCDKCSFFCHFCALVANEKERGVGGRMDKTNGDPNGQHKTKEWLEKIVIVGYAKQPTSILLKSAAGQQSLQGHYDSNIKTLVIRKPGLNIAEDFTLTVI